MPIAVRSLFLVFLLMISALGCGDRRGTSPGGNGGGELPLAWSVRVSPGAPDAVRWAAEDLVRYLSAMGLTAALEERGGGYRCERNAGRIVFLGEEIPHRRALESGESEQTFEILETRCASGRLVELWGGGLLGRQYAAYELAHALGVRFFHPEEEYVPAAPRWPEEPLARRHTPAFRWRSVTLHLTHPLELGDAFRSCDPDHVAEGQRYIDWQIKNLASGGALGLCDGELADRGLRRGFLVEKGLRFWGAQQGGSGTIDPDDPRPVEAQVADAIDASVLREPRPDYFTLNHQVTEFTGMPDHEVVDLLEYVAGYFAQNYPDVALLSQVHGTHTEPTDSFGVNYNALGQFAPDGIGLQFHPLMFYDLFRPAPVYGNESFAWMFDLMQASYERRRIWYFPEAAWWLTFDIPVPLYLPITIEARDRDIQGLSFMLAGGLDGHKVFGSGHEWGYWQNEYCSLRMATDVEYRWADCLADITAPMGAAASEVASVVQDVVTLQQRDFFDADLLRWIVGTDDETEAADAIGIVFHPLPPPPGEILAWSEDEVDAWLAETEPRLRVLEEEHAALTARLNAVAGEVPADAQSWFREIRDGVEINGLRARHQRLAYGALVVFRQSRLLADAGLEADAFARLDAARAVTQEAQEVVSRREADYRYHPLDRAIAGGPDGETDENWTIYGYRYLNRTHHLFYWHRIDGLVDEALRGAPEADELEIDSAVVASQESLRARVAVADLSSGSLAWGDGTSEATSGGAHEHVYAEPGLYEVVLTGTAAGEAFEERRTVAIVEQAFRTGLSGQLLDPPAASIIAPLIPGLVFGRHDTLGGAIGFDADGSGRAPPGRWIAVELEEDGAAFASRPVHLVVPIANAGVVLTSVEIAGATLRLANAGAAPQLRGEMVLESVVRAIVDIGGFEEQGARRLVADLLGFTPETLPESVPILVEWTLTTGP